MIVADAVVSGGVALGITVISWAFKALFSRDRDKAAGNKDNSEAFARERETWRQDYDHAYNQVRTQCNDCMQELNKFRSSLYGLFDDLEEQIAPMMMLVGSDPKMTWEAMRACIRKARDSVKPGKENVS